MTSLVSIREFEDLLVAQQQPLLNYIKSLLADHHEAEDVLQKTNLILWQKRDRFEAGSSFRAWAFTIARLESYTQIRRRSRDQRVFAGPDFLEASAPVVVPADDGRADTLKALRICLRRLPDRDRELLLTRYGSDRTLGEYASKLNRSPGTLKARLFKIRENLRKGIEEQLRRSGASLTAG
jgi:RNA polymerase sigma-70 factor (ECF subfamily)